MLSSFQFQTKLELKNWTTDSLQWDDFKSLPNTSSEHVAATDCHIKWTLKTRKDSIFITVFAYMNPANSWVKPQGKNERILKHEQIHFDIAELFARKLRQEILNQKFGKTSVSDILKTIAINNTKNYDAYQDKYDAETNHSKILSKQKEWEKRITNELKNLEAFNKTELIVLRK